MTNPAGAGIYANMTGVYYDGIHVPIYIAAPWIRHGYRNCSNDKLSAFAVDLRGWLWPSEGLLHLFLGNDKAKHVTSVAIVATSGWFGRFGLLSISYLG